MPCSFIKKVTERKDAAFFHKEHKRMQRMPRSFIKKVTERNVLFIKNARTFRSFEKNAKEHKNVAFF